MKIVTLFILATLFLPGSILDVQNRICIPKQVDTAIVWWGDEVGLPVYHAEKLWGELKALHGPSFWVKSGDYGHFAIPPDWWVEAKITLLPGRQSFWFARTSSQPDVVYVFAFPNDPVYADATGRHYGPHPTCGSFTISRSRFYNNIIKTAEDSTS